MSKKFFLLMSSVCLIGVARGVPVTNNLISGTQTISNQTAPSMFTGSTPGGGNGSSYDYVWLMSENTASSGYAVAPGIHNTQNYQSGTLTIPIFTPYWIYGVPNSKKVWFKRVVISGVDRDTSAAIEINIDNHNTWLGTVDNQWNNPANWLYPPGLTNYYLIPAGSPGNPVISGTVTVGDLTIDSGKTVTLAGVGDSLIINGSIYGGSPFPHYDGSKGTTIFTGIHALFSIPPGVYYNLNIGSSGAVMLYDVTVKNRFESTKTIREIGQLVIDTNCTYSVPLVRLDYGFVGYNPKITIRNIGTGGRTGNVLFPIESFPFGGGSVTINNTGIADNFTIRYLDSVRTDGATGSAVLMNAVNKGWIIHEDVPGGTNATIQLEWYPSGEMTGFDPTAAYIAYYHNNAWRPDTAAMVTFGTLNSLVRSGLTVFNNTVFGVASTGTLPVSLLEFNAQKQDAHVLLEWTTASESNNDHFRVQRSADGRFFETIGKVKGNGTQNDLSHYIYKDVGVSAAQGTLYYRLVQVDFDGTETVSDLLRISWDDVSEQLSMKVYPNPFFERTSVIVSQQNASSGIFKVTDITGRILLNKTVELQSGITEMELEEINAYEGMLFVTITSPEGSVTKRVLKQIK